MRSQVIANNAKDLKAYARKILDSGERLSFKKHMEGFTEAQKKELRTHHRVLRVKKNYHATYKHDPVDKERRRKASKKWRKDPANLETLKKHRQKHGPLHSERYHTDAEYREKQKAYGREYMRKKMADPVHREKVLDKARKKKKEKYHTDAEYREQQKAYSKKQRERKKKAAKLGEQESE